jgi:hypothetical protein
LLWLEIALAHGLSRCIFQVGDISGEENNAATLFGVDLLLSAAAPPERP